MNVEQNQNVQYRNDTPILEHTDNIKSKHVHTHWVMLHQRFTETNTPMELTFTSS